MEIPVGLPEDPIYDTLFQYQRLNLLEMGLAIDENIAIINSSDTGTGKTYVSSALCKWKGYSALVICPKPVVEAWFNVLSNFDVRILGVTNYESIKNGKYYENVEMYRSDKRVECPFIEVIKNDKDVDFEWDLPENTLIIFDEAHKGKNNITINSQLLVSTKKILSNETNIKLLILSATITDKIDCFRVAAYLLGLSQYGKHAFRAWLRKIERDFPGETQSSAIHKIIYPKYGSRMRIRDLKENDDVRINTMFKNNDVRAETYQMSPEAEKEITDAYQEIERATAMLKAKQQGEMCPLTLILRARQRIELLKVPTIIMLTMEYLLNEKSVVIFVNFNETKSMLFESLDEFVQKEFPGSFITFIEGGQDPKERQYNIDQFQLDRSRVMIANIKAGGVGVSMHDLNGQYPRVAIISPTWSSIDLKQCLGRIYRAGALTDSVQRIVYCKGGVSPAGLVCTNDTTFESDEGKGKVGVEEKIAENVNKKLKTIEWLNNNDEEDLTQL